MMSIKIFLLFFIMFHEINSVAMQNVTISTETTSKGDFGVAEASRELRKILVKVLCSIK